jgi:hypothetical protein
MIYLDSSAAVKLAHAEAESQALRYDSRLADAARAAGLPVAAPAG